MRSLPMMMMKMSKQTESQFAKLERKTRSYVVRMCCLNYTVQCNEMRCNDWLNLCNGTSTYRHSWLLVPVSWQFQRIATFCTCRKKPHTHTHTHFPHFYQRIKSDGSNRFYHFAWINTQLVRSVAERHSRLFVQLCREWFFDFVAPSLLALMKLL